MQNGQHWSLIDYTLCSWRWRNSTQSAENKTLSWLWLKSLTLTAKFKLKLKKVWKTTRPFRYNLNQIPYDYTVEVMNRFKALYLVNRVFEELWINVHNTVQEAVTKIIPKKKKCKKAKKVVWDVLQITEERREAKDKGKKERYTQLKAEF